MFRLLRAVFVTNQRLSEEGGFIFGWMVENYVDSALMLLRRELDRQDGAENLPNLLFDMIEHPTVVNRARYLARWGLSPTDKPWHANRIFDELNPIQVAGHPEADHLDPAVIKSDLDRVGASAEHLREYAERTRAHRSPGPALDTTSMTFAALHDALVAVREVIAKYYAVLTQASLAQWEAVPQFSTLQPFTRPWVEDRAAVERAIGEEPK
jgi:hypothetical protein